MRAYQLGRKRPAHAREVGERGGFVIGGRPALERIAFDQMPERLRGVVEVGPGLGEREAQRDLILHAQRMNIARQFLHRAHRRVARSHRLRAGQVEEETRAARRDPRGRFKRGARFAEAAELDQDEPFAVVRLRAFRLQRDRSLIARKGVLGTVEILERVSAIDMGLDEARLDAERLVEARQRLDRATQVPKRVGPVVERAGVTRPQRERPVIARDRFGRPLELFEHVAAIVERVEVIRLDRDRPLVARHGLGETLEIAQRIGEVEMRLGIIGLDNKRSLIGRKRLLRAPQRGQREPMVGLRGGVARISVAALSRWRSASA